jgi:hypothetical protein
MGATGARHKWDYGLSDAQNSRNRRCTVCYARGRRYGGRSTSWTTLMPGFKFAYSKVPPCPGTRWYRLTGPHPNPSVRGDCPRWELADGKGGHSHTITDNLIRTYGRKHMEKVFLAKLPPLPESAWAVLDGTYWAEIGDR